MNRLAFSSKKDNVLQQKHLIKIQCKKLLCLRCCGLTNSWSNVIYPGFSVGRPENCHFGFLGMCRVLSSWLQDGICSSTEVSRGSQGKWMLSSLGVWLPAGSVSSCALLKLQLLTTCLLLTHAKPCEQRAEPPAATAFSLGWILSVASYENPTLIHF